MYLTGMSHGKNYMPEAYKDLIAISDQNEQCL